MAGETEAAANIGVRLTLDATQFMTGIGQAQGALNTFQKQAAKAGSGASQMKAGGGTTASESSAAQNLAGVNVSLSVSKAQISELRTQIQRGLGVIPIAVTPVISKAARAEAQAVVSAVATPTIGTRSGAAHAVESAVKQNLPKKAFGGPVQQGRPVIVGEHRPEVFVPKTHGTIVPSLDRYYRDQEPRLRRRLGLDPQATGCRASEGTPSVPG